jgi:chemotaxis protein MotA
MDKSSLAGILLAVGGISVGLFLEGGKFAQVLQPTAAIIVFGGTLGAVMLQFPLRVIIASFRKLGRVFVDNSKNPKELIAEIVSYAHKARRDGIISLDTELPNINDPFLKKTVMLAVDGTEPQEIRKMMELELDNQAEHDENIPKVFESAGGFSPTIGIIGAVLGLIQVMQHLDDISEVGRGIAVAFVATIYGVAAANLFFLPVAGKITIRMKQEWTRREMMLEGVISIIEGMNPRMIETKLMGFFSEANQDEDKRISREP